MRRLALDADLVEAGVVFSCDSHSDGISTLPALHVDVLCVLSVVVELREVLLARRAKLLAMVQIFISLSIVILIISRRAGVL